MKKKKVMVIGDAMVDHYVVGDLNRISPEAPAPVLTVKYRECLPGGAANVAVNVLAQGVSVGLIGFKGCREDEYGEWLETRLAEVGIWTKLVPSERIRVPIKNRFVADGQILLRCDEEAILSEPITLEQRAARIYECFQLVDAFKKELDDVGMLVLSDYDKGTLPASEVPILIDAAVRQGIPVIVAPKGDWYGKYQSDGITVLTTNWREAVAFTALHYMPEEGDTKAAETMARRIADKLSARNVVITCQDRGAYWFDATSSSNRDWSGRLVSVGYRAVVDRTGVEDTFVATLAAEVFRGTGMFEAVVRANVAAAIAASKPGTATVSQIEVEDELQSTRKGVKKVVDFRKAALVASRYKKEGRKVGFLWGDYCHLQSGHVRCINQAKQKCDFLIVGVLERPIRRSSSTDETSDQRLEDRMEVLSIVESINLVIPVSQNDVMIVLREIEPDVLFVTGDDVAGPEAAYVADRGGRVVTLSTL